MQREKVTKFDAARRQIETAIRMIFDDADSISIHTLIHSATEILRSWGAAKGRITKVDQTWEDLIKPEYKKMAFDWMRRHANFFKHADKDPDGEIELLEPLANDLNALLAIQRYQELTGDITPVMTVLFYWIGWCNPHLVIAQPQPTAIHAVMQQVMSGLDRAEQLHLAKLILLNAEGQAEKIAPSLEELQRKSPRAAQRFAQAEKELTRLNKINTNQFFSGKPS